MTKNNINLTNIQIIKNFDIDIMHIYEPYTNFIINSLNKFLNNDYPRINTYVESNKLTYIFIIDNYISINDIKEHIKLLIKNLKIQNKEITNFYNRLDNKKIVIGTSVNSFHMWIPISELKKFIVFTMRYFKLSNKIGYNLYKKGLIQHNIEVDINFLGKDILQTLERLLNKDKREIITEQYDIFFDKWFAFRKE